MTLTFRHFTAGLAVGALLGLAPTAALAKRDDKPKIKVLSTDTQGNPTFITGDLGSVGPIDIARLEKPSFMQIFEQQMLGVAQGLVAEHFSAGGAETLEVAAVLFDDSNGIHVRFDQRIEGRAVHFAQLVLHVRSVDGQVFALNGHFASGLGAPRHALMTGGDAVALGLAQAGLVNYQVLSPAELVYVLDPLSRAVHLAFSSRISYRADKQASMDTVYVSALDGGLIYSDPHLQAAKHWTTHTADGTAGVTPPVPDLPPFTGRLQCQDEVCFEPEGQTAHDHMSLAYDYFLTQHGRRSYDDLDSEVFTTRDWEDRGFGNNAFWYTYDFPPHASSRKGAAIFGRGDGVLFSPLEEAFDIVVHEFAHGVTNNSSRLGDCLEMGGLNESMSDIFGAAAEAWRDGGPRGDTWKIGEDAFTPSFPGDAARYMNDPARDSVSFDRYEDYVDALPGNERAINTCPGPSIHAIAGISNLAFYLISEGGQHPRIDLSLPWATVAVPPIGIEKAAQIFYDAQVHYLTPLSRFENARYATQQVAFERFGVAEAESLERAWCAVGVLGCTISAQNQPPTARFTATCDADPSQPGLCTFDATSSTDDLFVETFTWDFGDGQTAAGAVVNHTYAAGDFYKVKLEVADLEGATDQAFKEIGAGPSNLAPKSGLWFNPGRSGHGIDLQRAVNGDLFLVWFTYRTDGTPIWYTAQGKPHGMKWRGELRRHFRQPTTGAFVSTSQGEVELDFSASDQADFRWDLEPLHEVNEQERMWDGAEPFEDFHFANGGTPVPLNGQWYDVNEPGWGYSIASQGRVQVLTAFIFNANGKAIWLQGTDDSGMASMDIKVAYPVGTNLHPGASGEPSIEWIPGADVDLQRWTDGTVRARPMISVPGVGSWSRTWTTLTKLE